MVKIVTLPHPHQVVRHLALVKTAHHPIAQAVRKRRLDPPITIATNSTQAMIRLLQLLQVVKRVDNEAEADEINSIAYPNY